MHCYPLALVRALGLLLILVSCVGAQAQISDINSAVNKAGRQRMLSQRMAKAYFQLGQGVDVERSRQVLDSSISLFDRQLVELKNFAPTPEIKETYLKLEKSWLAYKDVLIGSAPSPSKGKIVLELSDEVLTLANQGTAQFEKHSNTSSTRMVNVAGRQRMLSQRLAKFYQAAAWQVPVPSYQSEVDKARKEFNDAIQELAVASSNSPALSDEVRMLRQQWVFFENALDQPAGADKKLALHVATTSERILQLAENITGQFERQNR